MKAYSLGKIAVTTAGTPVQVTSDATIMASAIRIQAVPANTGAMHVGVAALVKATGVGVVASLAIPGAGQPAAVELATGDGCNSLRLADYWVDAAVNAEGVYVAYWVR